MLNASLSQRNGSCQSGLFSTVPTLFRGMSGISCMADFDPFETTATCFIVSAFMPINKNKALAALIGCVLAIGTAAIFWRVLGCDFILYDDNLYITQNSQVQSGLTQAMVKWAFVSVTAGHWHPLTWLSHALDCQLYGLRPGMHH